ncbi:hypothetical protein [Paenibacillus protaetiae]|uniref:DUF707 domain-containing protein n=1 Tax=Paenibacillus protaetiae TaxID=2509456 RepID=A0A4P6ETT5_9BACL|nr:hypothetical protein [Paenibacillus protaetiae]QAY65049.1 hypothetical protein ET464_00245 [Paenibacillus protaetiae]
MPDRSFLVIVRAGDQSQHETWLNAPIPRHFDLFVSYSGSRPGAFAAGCDRYEQRQGSKYAALAAWINELGGLLDGYQAIWLPDDNIQTDVHGIHQLFKLFSEYKLSLAHPAFKKHAKHPLFAHHIDYLLRYTNVVSSAAPVFTPEALRLCLPVFGKSSSGSSLGYIWPKLLPHSLHSVAIMDGAPVKRTLPAPLPLDDGYEDGSPHAQDASLLAEYGVYVPRPEELRFDDGVPLWPDQQAGSEASKPVRKGKAKPAPIRKTGRTNHRKTSRRKPNLRRPGKKYPLRPRRRKRNFSPPEADPA